MFLEPGWKCRWKKVYEKKRIASGWNEGKKENHVTHVTFPFFLSFPSFFSLSPSSFFSNFLKKKVMNVILQDLKITSFTLCYNLLKGKGEWKGEKSQLSPFLSSSIFLPWFLIFLTDVNWKQKKIFDRRKKKTRGRKRKGDREEEWKKWERTRWRWKRRWFSHQISLFFLFKKVWM